MMRLLIVLDLTSFVFPNKFFRTRFLGSTFICHGLQPSPPLSLYITESRTVMKFTIGWRMLHPYLGKAGNTGQIWRLVEKRMVSSNNNIPRAICPPPLSLPSETLKRSSAEKSRRPEALAVEDLSLSLRCLYFFSPSSSSLSPLSLLMISLPTDSLSLSLPLAATSGGGGRVVSNWWGVWEMNRNGIRTTEGLVGSMGKRGSRSVQKRQVKNRGAGKIESRRVLAGRGCNTLQRVYTTSKGTGCRVYQGRRLHRNAARKGEGWSA
ncbi:hypothetical protein YC2023_060552 [Brassica napus]